MRDGQTVGYYVWVIKVYVICVRLRTQPKNFEKLKCKKSLFLVYGKMLVIQFPYMKKILIIDLSCNFLYVWNCMESV